jgi:hypothetical protein
VEHALSTGGGWARDLPDPRDYGPIHERVRGLLAELKPGRRGRSQPAQVNWEEHYPPAWESHGLAAGAALAVASVVSYFQRRVPGRLLLPSWLYLYKMARVLGHQTGNACPSLRQTLKALVRFGLPSAEFGPSDPCRFDEAPEPFLFCFARDYADVVYVRLDTPDVRGRELLASVKRFVAAGFPVAFGVCTFATPTRGPEIPYPCGDAAQGGTVLVAVGYDDAVRVGSEVGALRVRAPLGPCWGEEGYGWLPYRYLEAHLGADFWTALRPDWLAGGEFTSPY